MPRHAYVFDAPEGSVCGSPSGSRHCSAASGGSASRFDDPTDADCLVLVQDHSLNERGQTMCPFAGMRPDPLGCGGFSSPGEVEQTCYWAWRSRSGGATPKQIVVD